MFSSLSIILFPRNSGITYCRKCGSVAEDYRPHVRMLGPDVLALGPNVLDVRPCRPGCPTRPNAPESLVPPQIQRSIAVLTCGEAEGKAKLSPPPRSQVEHLVPAHIVRRNKVLDEVSTAIPRDRVARNAEVTCDRRETGSPTGCRNPSLEIIRQGKYPIPQTHIQSYLSLN